MEALEFLKLSKHHLASKKEIKKFSQVDDGKMRYLNDLIFGGNDSGLEVCAQTHTFYL